MATIQEIAKAAGVASSTVSRVLRGKPPFSEKTRLLVEETARRLAAQETQPSGQPVTIRDVAALAGVSISTVSNVLNEYPVGEESRRRVQDAVAALHYEPNIMGRSLRKERNRRIIAAVSNPTWHALQGIYSAAGELGIDVLLMHSGINRQEDFVHRLEGGLAQGILFFDFFDERVVADLGRRFHVVQCGSCTAAPEVSAVSYDYTAVGRELTQLLLDSGRRRIAMITGRSLRDEPVSFMNRFEAGYRAAMEQAGQCSPAIYSWGTRIFYSFDYQFLEQFVCRCMQEPGGLPEAFLAPTGEGAAVLVQVLRNHELRVPEDVAVAAFLSTDNSKATVPYITSMQQDWYTLGYDSVKLLAEMIDSGAHEARKVTVPHTILMRGSTHAALAPFGERELEALPGE